MSALTPQIIGLTGPAECGKSTIAVALTAGRTAHQGASAQVLSFATPLKTMLTAGMGALGDYVASTSVGEKSERSTVLNNHTVRHALQTLGTEWGRIAMATPGMHSIWVEAAMRSIARAQDGITLIVLDDVRFQDEADAIRERGGVVVGLQRLPKQGSLTGAELSHVSEAGVTPDFVVTNVGTPAAVAAMITQEIERAKGLY